MYHPVLQDADDAAAHTSLLISELQAADCAVLALAPNADAGSGEVLAVLQRQHPSTMFALQTHLARADFIAAMATADIMVGNSSAGIIEAASFGTPVLNVGPRQNLRERNANVNDIACTRSDVREGIAAVLKRGRYPLKNVYGDGRAAGRIAALLADIPLNKALLMKVNGY
jgi:GDP/UDP-N,N'-diacetylbacillosamine 2-epimerase (hydrolysing)